MRAAVSELLRKVCETARGVQVKRDVSVNRQKLLAHLGCNARHKERILNVHVVSSLDNEVVANETMRVSVQ